MNQNDRIKDLNIEQISVVGRECVVDNSVNAVWVFYVQEKTNFHMLHDLLNDCSSR